MTFGMWTCKRCGEKNADMEYKCAACGTPFYSK